MASTSLCGLAAEGLGSRGATLRGFAAVASVAAIVLLTGLATPAQVRTTGQIAGTVTDPSGAVVPSAAVTASEAATGFTQTVRANKSGSFTFAALLPGAYQLTVSAPGFANAAVSGVVVNAAETTNLKIGLKVGTRAQSVEVSARGQVLKTTTNTLSTTITPVAIQNLPLSGRDLLQFAQLVSGAQSGGGERYTTYDNLPNAAINITVDGTNDNFQRYRTASTGFFTSAPLREGAFDEVTVSTNDLTADSGAEGSSIIRFVTKRGTNHFHGSGFWQAQNSFFNANTFTRNALKRPLPKTRLNDYGGSLGGPIFKNKLFFFVNYEEEDVPSSGLRTVNVMTPQAEQGLYTYNVASIPSAPPAWITCNAGANTCTADLYKLAAANGFSATADSTMAGLLGQINGYEKNGSLSAGAPSSPFLQSLSWDQPVSRANRYPTTRLDYQITPNLAWHSSWDLYWRSISNVPNYPGSNLAGDGFKSTYYTWSNSLDWIISPTLLNQASFGTQSNVEEFNPGTVPNPFAAQGNRVIALPFRVPTPIPGFILPIPRNNPLWNPADAVTWTHGNHTFNFGADMRIANMHELEVNDPPTYFTGVDSFDPADAMFATANFPGISKANNNYALNSAASLYAALTGRLNNVSGFNWVNVATRQYAVEGQALAKEEQTVGGVYFQDSWRVTPHLALNYGLRWQFSGAVHNTNNFYFSPTLANLLGPSVGLFQPGQLNGVQNPAVTLRPSPYNADLNQPSPNFGFAWNPDFQSGLLRSLTGGNRTVIRGGYSISHYDEGWITFENATLFTNPGTGQSVFAFPVAGAPSGPGEFQVGTASLSDPSIASKLAGFPTAFTESFPESLFTFGGQPFATVDPNIRSPYVQSWNFGIQRQLPGNTVVEADYVGNHVVHIWQTFDLNEVNIFENGFLSQFKTAQANLAANQAAGKGATFADNTGAPGVAAVPIFDAAFSGQAPSAGFANPGFVTYLQQGQAGALASALAGSSTYLCNLVGGNAAFTPCGGSGGAYPINMFQANPYAAGQPLSLLSDPSSSTYNALQLQVRHPTGHGLMLGANYTFSRSLTGRYLGSDDSATVNFTTLRNMGLNKGPSAYDIHNVFRTYFTYRLPFGRGQSFDSGNPVLDQVIGGWVVGAVVTAQSGRPFQLQGGYESFNGQDGGVVLNGASRAQLQNAVGVYPGPNASHPISWLNPGFSATALAPEQTPGALGQTIFLYGPKLVNTDISLQRVFPIHESIGLSFQASFLNAFNHANWNVGGSAPGDYVNISAPLFNVAALANSPRVIQFRTQLQF